ncbi:MAG: hypothetical protein PVF58_17250 [Candidatus Methanofastidiosia archaeon]
MKKVSIIDIFVIVLVGVSLFSFSVKYQPRYTYEFSGSQIYKVVKECEVLDGSGFLYTVFVKGYWNVDVGHFEQEGFVIGTGRGYIEMVLKNGRVVTIGGKMGYKEDIQATEVEIRIKNKSSVSYVLRPITGDTNKVKEYIVGSTSFIGYGKEDIAITCELAIAADVTPNIVTESEIEDVLRKTIFFMKDVSIDIHTDGVKVSVVRLSMEEFDTFFEILEKYFTVKEMYTGDINVIFQTSEEIDVNDVVPLEAYQGGAVYSESVHVRV